MYLLINDALQAMRENTVLITTVQDITTIVFCEYTITYTSRRVDISSNFTLCKYLFTPRGDEIVVCGRQHVVLNDILDRYFASL